MEIAAAREEAKKAARGLQRNKKGSYVNDGRPPDTTDALLSPYKKGRRNWPKNSSLRRRAPLARDVVSTKHIRIWGYEIGDIRVTDICPLASPLILLYLLRRHGVIRQETYRIDQKLSSVLDKIDADQPDTARHDWLTRLMYI